MRITCSELNIRREAVLYGPSMAIYIGNFHYGLDNIFQIIFHKKNVINYIHPNVFDIVRYV